MTLSLNAATLGLVNQDLKDNNYAAAYKAINQYLTKAYPGATGDDADVMHWLQVAYQVNSGETTLDAIAIRANNAAAVQLEEGQTIALFGPQLLLLTPE